MKFPRADKVALFQVNSFMATLMWLFCFIQSRHIRYRTICSCCLPGPACPAIIWPHHKVLSKHENTGTFVPGYPNPPRIQRFRCRYSRYVDLPTDDVTRYGDSLDPGKA